MVCGSSKRVVVIRDIHSNIIEEVILVLKGEPGKAEQKNPAGTPQAVKNKAPDFIMKEAELIIDNYIKENKLQGGKGKATGVKSNTGARKFMVDTIINMGLLGSVAILVFIIAKLI